MNKHEDYYLTNGSSGAPDSLFRVLTESATVGIVHTTLDFKLIYANPTMKSWMEVDNDETLHEKSILEYFTPDSIGKIREEVKLRVNGVGSVYEVEFVSRSGRRRTLVISGIPLQDKDGNLDGLIATLIDVSDYKRAVAVLRKTVESMPDGVMVIDHLGKILAYNQRFISIWEVPPGIMEAETQDALLMHLQKQLVEPGRFMAKRERSYSDAITDFEDNQFQLKNGRAIEVYRRTENFVDNTFVRVICVRDVTDRLKMEARLKHADRMATIGTMAAGVAHEINNPLTHLIGGLELLAEKLGHSREITGHEVTEIQSRIQVLLNSSVRISSIVKDLKTFSRPDVEQTEPVDLRSVIESTIGLLSLELNRKAKVEISFGKIPMVMANEGRLGQVIMNLIINAIQAVQSDDPQKNVICITTGVTAGGQVFAEVKDNGVGIPPEVMSRVFQPFFTTKSTGAGTGLGLSICYNIIKSFKGEIDVESTVGKGTLFRVLLPPATEVPVAVPPRIAKTSARRGRVLVIDDELDICDLMTGALSPEHDVVCSYNGGEALKLLLPNPLQFDLVLCDLTMPIISGIDIFEEVRSRAPEMEDRFLFITGGALTKEAEQLLRVRSHQVLTKPFNLRDLRDAVSARIL